MMVMIMKKEDSRFICIGLIMYDTLIYGINTLPRHWEETLRGTGNFSDTGGGAANSARTLGRLGADVSIVGRIGSDGIGDRILQTFISDHVSTDLLIRDPDTASGIATALVADNGQRCFLTVQGANRFLNINDMDSLDFTEYAYVHINGYFQFPSLEPDMYALLSRAKKAGSVISFDTASWDPTGKWYESIRPFSAFLDYFFANETQLKQLTGRTDTESAAKALLEDGVGNVVAKHGENGSTLYSSDCGPIHTKAFPVHAIDTTGAGDSYDAAYMLGLSKGWSQQKAGQFANVVAGLNCGYRGAACGVPSFEEAVEKMEYYYSRRKTICLL